MKEYSSATDIRSECKIIANRANRTEDSAHDLEVSAENRLNNAALNAANSQESSMESKHWAVEESKQSSIQAGVYKDSIAAIIEAARSYAAGDIGYREGEDSDNAKLYYSLSCGIKTEYLKKIQTVVEDVISYVGLDGEIDVS